LTLVIDKLDETYRRHAPVVFRRARQLLGNDADAQDVVHDVFVSLLQRPEQYAGRSAITTFLYSATTHACLSRIRNRNNRARLLQEHTTDAAVTAVTQPELQALVDLHEALRRMPEQLARVAVYACIDDLSHAEIAELVGCSRRHVSNLLERVADWGKSQEEYSCS
jgi:RNA polymerase sigma-70 factor (ECF subfamily)